MSDKKWLKRFVLALALVLVLCAGANMLVDPFGVFGDRLFNWYSYNETNNPRVAKLAWLDEHHTDYDSYIIGSSSAASYNVEELNEYMDARFYNLFVYGCDTRDYEDFARYILENYEVKNIILNVGINEGNTYDTGEGLTETMHARATGESLLGFYLRYAFANPRYAWDKVMAYFDDTELPQVFDVFDVDSGCYDKRVRDVEKIGDPAVYNEAHGGDFAVGQAGNLKYAEDCARSIANIRDMCDEKGVELICIASPVYIAQWEAYDREALSAYKSAISAEVDIWDFSLTALSYDSRYFYDATHFRNAVGTMVLAEIFGNEDIWRPEDFGDLVARGGGQAHTAELFDDPPRMDESEYTADVPILLYHHFGEDTGGTVISEATFRSHMELLAAEGYTAVTMPELVEYVYRGGELPEKTVCITFDDGYMSNYEIAMPILEELGLRATVFTIGVSIGHTEFYKDTDYPITPHFGYSEAAEMLSSGVMDIQSHSYDLHQWAPFESGGQVRENMLALPGEGYGHYAAVLKSDHERLQSEFTAELGLEICALAYPGGAYDVATEVIIHELGIPVTLSTATDCRNVLVRGLPQSLYALCRWNMTEDVDTGELLNILKNCTS